MSDQHVDPTKEGFDASSDEVTAAEETPALSDEEQQRRDQLIAEARQATAEQPELAGLVDRVAALADVDLPRHVEVLDEAHRTLRDALAAAGRDEPSTS